MAERSSSAAGPAVDPARGAGTLPVRNRRMAVGLLAWIVLLMLLAALVAWLKN
ncbi:MAG TPA: hypothetical protein VHF87_01965 [Methylomirabilota bacterium]|nr:hypothetical protein [Methylomirabilota bacterium]